MVFRYFFFACLPLALGAHAQPTTGVSFAVGPGVQLPAGARPNDVAVADFTHDGRPDMAVAARGTDSVAIFAQSATGGFPARPTASYFVPGGANSLVPIALTGYGPAGSPAPTADDLVAAVPSTNVLHFFDNTGTAPGALSLTPRPWVPLVNMGTQPTGARLLTGPFNNDAYPDLAFLVDSPPGSRHGLGGMAVYPNSSGTNRLLTRLMFYSRFLPVDFSIAPMSGPGSVDALLANPAANEVLVALGGAGSLFSDPWWATGDEESFPSFGVQPVAAAGGDVNGDGRPDLVAAHATSLNLVVQLRDLAFPRQIVFQAGRLTYPLLGVPRQVVLQDLNSDGRPELLALLTTGVIQVFPNTGRAGQALFDPPLVLFTGADPAYLRLADVNGDGRLDLAVPCAGSNTVEVFYNQSTPLAVGEPGAWAVHAYPNPARTALRLQVPAGAVRVAVLVDAVGRRVREWAAPGDALPVADLPRGWYVLQLVTAAGSRSLRVVLD
jgi:hypothetical protein